MLHHELYKGDKVDKTNTLTDAQCTKCGSLVSVEHLSM